MGSIITLFSYLFKAIAKPNEPKKIPTVKVLWGPTKRNKKEIFSHPVTLFPYFFSPKAEAQLLSFIDNCCFTSI